MVSWMGCGDADSGASGSGGESSGTSAVTTGATTTGGATTSAGGSASCGAGTSLCGDACVDTAHDPAHCGACGAACAEGEVCSMGQCAIECLGGSTKCGDACIDVDHDPAHCGGCDVACLEGEVCSDGQCTIECLGGTTKCGDLCVDTANDPAHCGACDNACPNADDTVAACVSGVCEQLRVCPNGTQAAYGVCIRNLPFNPGPYVYSFTAAKLACAVSLGATMCSLPQIQSFAQQGYAGCIRGWVDNEPGPGLATSVLPSDGSNPNGCGPAGLNPLSQTQSALSNAFCCATY